jgi:hypothetical protein
VELSEQEEQIVERIRRAKLFVFLRRHRHELLDEEFQQEDEALLIELRERQLTPEGRANTSLFAVLKCTPYNSNVSQEASSECRTTYHPGHRHR